MEIYLASDHAAFAAKQQLVSNLTTAGHTPIDLGPETDDRCDYPEFAIKLVREIQVDSNRVGVLLCGSGIGVSMAANRFKGIRAALCRSEKEAVLARQHNDANILCVGGRISSDDQILKIVQAWLSASFEGGRHIGRIEQFNQLGEE